MSYADYDKYWEALREDGLLQATTRWLEDNPPPPEWEGSRWAWAYTEAPISSPSIGANPVDE